MQKPKKLLYLTLAGIRVGTSSVQKPYLSVDSQNLLFSPMTIDNEKTEWGAP